MAGRRSSLGGERYDLLQGYATASAVHKSNESVRAIRCDYGYPGSACLTPVIASRNPRMGAKHRRSSDRHIRDFRNSVIDKREVSDFHSERQQ